MTYGPFSQHPPSYPPSRMPRQGRSALLTAPVRHEGRLFQAGIAIALAGAILLIFSCLNWVVFEFAEDGATASWSFSGLGGADIDVSQTTVSAERVQQTEAAAARDLSAPGGWTLAFGVLLIALAAPMVVRRFQGIAAVGACVVSIAALITAITFVSSPMWALAGDRLDEDVAAAGDLSRGYGLWFVFVGALFAAVAGAYSLALVLFPEKFSASNSQFGNMSHAGLGQQPGFPPHPGQWQPNYGQPAPGQQQQGGFPPVPPPQTPSYGQQPPQAPGHGQQPPNFGPQQGR